MKSKNYGHKVSFYLNAAQSSCLLLEFVIVLSSYCLNCNNPTSPDACEMNLLTSLLLLLNHFTWSIGMRCVMFMGSLYHILLDFINFTLRTLWSTEWITEYHENRPGLNVLQQRIDDYITAHEARLEQVICPLTQWLNLNHTFSFIMASSASKTDFMSFDCDLELYFLLGWNLPKCIQDVEVT